MHLDSLTYFTRIKIPKWKGILLVLPGIPWHLTSVIPRICFKSWRTSLTSVITKVTLGSKCRKLFCASSFAFFTQACSRSSDGNVYSDRPTFIQPVDKEVQDLASEVAKSHFQQIGEMYNFQDVVNLIVQQLEMKHHQTNYSWNCLVGFQFAISQNGFKYWTFFQEPSTKLSIFCSIH